MDVDDLKRDKDGVVVSLRDDGNGKVRIILDDVTNLSGTGQGDWEHSCFVTWKQYDSTKINELDLSDKELADFGHYILARLVAIKSVKSRQ